ncbi:MAG: hypothetical protein J6X60_03825 [Ruminiclostridium sp.]|nr:hypothetical protein [Ruminiclostridium sp.]
MKNTSGKIMLLISAVAVCVCGAVRFFQMESLTEPDTGFFYRDAGFGGIIIYILLAVFAVAIIALAFIGNARGESAYRVSSDGMGKNATRFLGLSEVAGALFIGWSAFEGKEIMPTVTCVISAICLLISGFVLCGRIVPPTYTGYVKLPLAVCLFLRTALFFNSDLIVLNHAENLIILMSCISFTLFAAANGRFYARVETKRSRIAEVIFALLTFLFSGVHTLSDFIAAISGGTGTKIVNLNTDAVAGFLISGTFLTVLFFTKKSRDIVPVTDDN